MEIPTAALEKITSGNLLLLLPPDLFVHLVRYFDPQDILSIRRSCKSLQSATYERSIWVLFLLRICSSSSVFLPSFPMESMSSKELERAVLVPEKFTSLIKQQTLQQPGSLNPTMTRTIRSEYPVWKVLLVPGGRFLITFSPRLVSLWDLGVDKDGWDVPEYPMAKIDIRREMSNLDGLPQDMVHATTDGKGILISVVYEKSVEIHVCYPADRSPSFVKVDKLETDTPIWKSVLTDTQVVTLLLGRTIVVWDFKQNTYASWRIVEDPTRVYGMNVDIGTSTVSVLDEFGHATYVIPSLQLRENTPESTEADEHPTRLGDYQWHRYGYAGVQPLNWYLGTTQPLFMDLLQSMGRGRGHEIHRFLLGSRMTDKSRLGLNTIPLKATFRLRTSTGPHSTGALRKCGEGIFKFWMWENGVCVHLGNACAPYVESDKKSPDSFVRLLADEGSQQIHRPDVCPVSGRVASVSLTSSLYEVHITDYIS
ncbi:hypothetical protein BDQ17DRAFT_1347142 [Cyathus striatus]|nr:hypothetical protein BDQ17DRAFT_1347142 [Cyathus striatus]